VSQDDPFSSAGDTDRTVIRPMPGGRRSPGRQTAEPQAPAAAPGPVAAVPWGAAVSGASADNPLVQCAAPLLAVAAQLRRTLAHPDPAGLRTHLVEEMRRFEANARARGIADSTVLPARYALCALIDEAVLGTPWGSESIWSKQGLLVSFHNETWGGEKFYLLLDRLIANPSANIEMLELLYLCLALGFEGRYRVRDGGQDELRAVRERLYQVIRRQRGEPEPELSIHWRGVEEKRDPLIHFVPLWVLSAVAGAVLLAMFAGFTFSLNQASDPVFLGLRSLDSGLPAIAPPREPSKEVIAEPPAVDQTPGPPPLTLRILLADDIAAGRLEVVDQTLGQTVIIRGDGLFRSGKSSIRDEYQPLLNEVGEALAKLPGRVLVTGHTDSVPIKTLRFPSNWHLSKERADSVAARLAEIIGDPGRFTVEGMGDTQPRVPENPKDARNRRVEITLAAP